MAARDIPGTGPAPGKAGSGSGGVDTRHPDLIEIESDYRLMRDVKTGTRAIKRQGRVYLPFPSGFSGQTDGGEDMYAAYMNRAQFPEMFSTMQLGMLGVLHRREAQVEGLDEGTPLAYLWERATSTGLTLEQLHARISAEILQVGRVALMADAPAGGGEPYIALYEAESLINWSEDRDFFVFEELYRTRSGYSWEDKKRYRVVEKTSAGVTVRLLDESGAPLVLSDRDEAGNQAPSTLLMRQGGRPMSDIPVVVAGARDLEVTPDEIPLIGVGRSCVAIYQLSADYRHQLFMSGQETLFVFGVDDAKKVPRIVGSGVIVSLPGEGDAKYVGPSGVTIQAQRQAITDEFETAVAAGARFVEVSGRGAESGEALKTRVRGVTASLLSVALCSAAALEAALRHVAVMKGEDPTKIVVRPNLDFVEEARTPEDAERIVEMWLNKAISYQTLYEQLQKAEIASQERDAADEQELVAEEEASLSEETAALGEDETGMVPDAELANLFDPTLTDQLGQDELAASGA